MRTVDLRSGPILLKSALTDEGRFLTTERAASWLKATAAERPQVVDQIPFDGLGQWFFEDQTGDLVHRSGKFFRVTGVRVNTDLGPQRQWEQPIIDQPEIGILGILAREFDGVLHLLMQAKMEPGNPLGVQLTPTVQATRSNYTQVHQGTRPPYLDYFLDRDHSTVIVDQLQWEHGSAFLRKRNRNIVVRVTGDVPVEPGFNWLTLAQVKKLLTQPNLVSMDTRTVIACLPLIGAPGAMEATHASGFGAAVLESFASTEAASTDEELQSWLTELKCLHRLVVDEVGLSSVSAWRRTEREISHEGGDFFKVIAVDVTSASREVARWTQPMIAPVAPGFIAFLTTEINGVLHALVKARAEPGSGDTVIVGPTVQSALGFEGSDLEGDHGPFLELVRKAEEKDIRYSCVQSEEGGRFYHVQSEYRIVHMERGHLLALPPSYRWLSLRQLQDMVRYGLLSVEARSLLSCLSFT